MLHNFESGGEKVLLGNVFRIKIAYFPILPDTRDSLNENTVNLFIKSETQNCVGNTFQLNLLPHK